MKKVAAVVVTYNRKELLLQNIESLLKQTYNSCLDILIIDNASTDGTVNYIADYITQKKVIYINTGKNLGGAGGFNYGIKEAYSNGYEYIWIMDDDTIPQVDALENLISADISLNHDYGYLASNVLWKDDTICLMNRQKYKYKHIEPSKYKENLIKSTQASFVSLFFRREVVKKIGLPIKDFFIWGDDVEYTRRMSITHNLPCYMVKNSKVNHLMGVNSGSNIAVDIPERISRYRYAYRNEFFTYKREGFLQIGYYFLKCIYHLMKIIAYGKNPKKQRLIILVNAVREGFSFNPPIEFVD